MIKSWENLVTDEQTDRWTRVISQDTVDERWASNITLKMPKRDQMLVE